MEALSMQHGCAPFVFAEERDNAGNLVPTPKSLTGNEHYRDRQVFPWPVGFQCPNCNEAHTPDFPILLATIVALGRRDSRTGNGRVLSSLCGTLDCTNPFHSAFDSAEGNARRAECMAEERCVCDQPHECQPAPARDPSSLREKGTELLSLVDGLGSSIIMCSWDDCGKVVSRRDMAKHIVTYYRSGLWYSNATCSGCSQRAEHPRYGLQGLVRHMLQECDHHEAEVKDCEDLVMPIVGGMEVPETKGRSRIWAWLTRINRQPHPTELDFAQRNNHSQAQEPSDLRLRLHISKQRRYDIHATLKQ